ncbi:MAG: DUF4236 domain-containing protein [Verrucomicrobia bacterium]|nr:MAG: DUF4236 domain-containing protein [Verrucomicrobiota bacterium]TAE89262.1 MAG: DUF4236 domain-containing protein [Verrucomicrobiota bacterium]TAF27864.1 MAG: DUF4236 domain-containing protein [Verrucomicrobiota bacterium]TAF42713.1 MAG: DUF4236 domain-containing protein [Verrucomicrobiota bacterium]
MGFYYRKSINLGPFRINLSKSGIGYSVGTRGVRVGTSARGRRYTNLSIPGTGIGHRGSCLLLLATIPTTLATAIWIARHIS